MLLPLIFKDLFYKIRIRQKKHCNDDKNPENNRLILPFYKIRLTDPTQTQFTEMKHSRRLRSQ